MKKRNYLYYIKVNGNLYEGTGGESQRKSYVYSGRITSHVDEDKVPSIDDQSNFGADYSYSIISKERIDVYIGGHWWVHKKVKEK